jgi:hypothetical protein
MTPVAGPQPGALDLEIRQGSTFSLPLTYRDAAGAVVNLAGSTARLQVRSTVASATTLLELTTENGGIAVAATAPNLTLTISAAATAALSWDERSPAVYDLELVSGGVVIPLLAGYARLKKEVTR